MALNAYLKLSGAHQGAIHGSVTQKGREDTIKVLSYSFGSEASDGQPHPGEFMVTLDADESSPKLLIAFAQQEAITVFELDVWATNIQGVEILEQKWELEDGRIASLRSGGITFGTSAALANEVTFSFGVVTQTWVDAGIVGEWDVRP
jgi:type VI secretion system Hcp family effector